MNSKVCARCNKYISNASITCKCCLQTGRAKGKKLDDLKGEETFDVKLRILLR